MSIWGTAMVGDLVVPVATWNPLRASADKLFRYIDLGSIDQATKQIVDAREVVCGDAPSRARQLVSTGDVLVSTVRPNLNGVAHVPSALSGATASTGFCVLRSNSRKLNDRYLFHWVKTPEFVRNMVQKSTGANYPAVSDKIILGSMLPLPHIAEQQRISKILDLAEAIQTKRREMIANLDHLSRAIFVDMFKEALSDAKRIRLSSLVAEFRYGTSGKAGPDGFVALRIPNVASGSLDLRELKTVAVQAAEFERLRLKDDDMLFVRTNGNPDNVGRCAVFETSHVSRTGFDSSQFIFASYLIRARLKKHLVLPVVLQQFLSTDEGRREIRARSTTTAGHFNINTEGLGSLPIPAFPEVLQEKFARVMRCTERLKANHRAMLANSAELFAALQQRAFRGEL